MNEFYYHKLSEKQKCLRNQKKKINNYMYVYFDTKEIEDVKSRRMSYARFQRPDGGWNVSSVLQLCLALFSRKCEKFHTANIQRIKLRDKFCVTCRKCQGLICI